MEDSNGMANQPIHQAAAQGDLAALQRLLAQDPTLLEANGWFGTKPLHYAEINDKWDKWAGSPWELPPRAPTDPDLPN